MEDRANLPEDSRQKKPFSTLCFFQSHRYYDEIFFYHEGGVDIGDVDAKAERIQIKLPSNTIDPADLAQLLSKVPAARTKILGKFICGLYEKVYTELHYSYLEINPLVMLGDNSIYPLDLAAKLDETAAFLVNKKWGPVDFPSPFGEIRYPEEEFIQQMDEKTGSSLKLTVINPNGRVWLMVAGGGASVVYADTVVDAGYGHELANYGEYSGAPTAEETFNYAKTLFQLIFKSKKKPQGNVFLIGGGIANFTDVSSTFGGLIKAIRTFKDELRTHNVSFWVRRAGLNFLEGLRKIKSAVLALDLPIRVYGPETHMTAIVPMSLGLMDMLPEPDLEQAEYLKLSGPKASTERTSSNMEAPSMKDSPTRLFSYRREDNVEGPITEKHPHVHYPLRTVSTQQLTSKTTCIVYNLQQAAVQRMLDFDGLCGRERPSVSAVVFPFGGRSNMKVYWNVKEIFIPVYPTIREALDAHTDVTMMINFASFRSSFDRWGYVVLLVWRRFVSVAILVDVGGKGVGRESEAQKYDDVVWKCR